MSKIVQHPGVESTPQMTLAEALGIAQAGDMVDCLVMYTDTKGVMHIAWSDQSNADLASSAVVLSHLAATRLMEDAP
jgi:hypothetical protein